MEVKPGESIALVGYSGCGKSTIIQLIERYYDIEDNPKDPEHKGGIFFDGINVKELNLYELRRKIGLVSQEPVLFKRSVYENIKPCLNHSYKKWNEIFSRVIHENIANLSFNGLVMKDSRMPYFGFSEVGYNIPDDRDFIGNILRYLKNAKKSKDSMAEELICTSLFQIFELTHGSKRNEYIFCSHDLSAIARINKAIQTSYSNMQEQFKSINVFSFIQFMVEKGLISSKEEVVEILRKIMGENVRLIIGQDIPFTPVEKMMTIEEATERIFKGEHIEYVGRRT